MYQNAGEKGRRHADPEDPPRRRGNRFNGHGTYANDRPPVLGILGRESGEVTARRTYTSTRRELETMVVAAVRPGATVNTDERHAYDYSSRRGLVHQTVNHRSKEWARDDDDDGVREVHCNGIEGFWLGLRNFLRMFRGVSKWHLDHYVVFYACIHRFKYGFQEFLGQLLGRSTPSIP
jgi:transposase-like protein